MFLTRVGQKDTIIAYARVVNMEYKNSERPEAAVKNWSEKAFQVFHLI